MALHKATGNFEVEGLANPRLHTTHAQAPNAHFPKSEYLHVVKHGRVEVFQKPRTGGMVKAKLVRGAWGHTYAKVGATRIPVTKRGDVWVISGRDR